MPKDNNVKDTIDTTNYQNMIFELVKVVYPRTTSTISTARVVNDLMDYIIQKTNSMK